MISIKFNHIKRISLSSKLYPRLKPAQALNPSKLKSSDQFDGETFCGGRSKNKDILTFFGLINESANNCANYSQFPIFRRSIKKLTELVELELENVGALEVLLPALVPQRLWEKSGRIARHPDTLRDIYRLKDNSGLDLILGPTFEESITHLIAKSGNSINTSQLPLLLYQTSTKFRYEPTPKFGLIRSNEFLMNDLYSFDADQDRAKETYDLISSVYQKIFSKLGLNCLKIESHTGFIGGTHSHEYQLAVTSGEDKVIVCNNCGYAFNYEMYQDQTDREDACIRCNSKDIVQSQTLELGHTFLLSDLYSRPLNAKFSTEGKEIFFEMGCYGLGLSRIIGAGIDLLSTVPSTTNNSPLQIRWPNLTEPYSFAIVCPAKRSKIHAAGSTGFIQNLTDRIIESTKKIDILIEDKDDGIAAKIARLKALGIPRILVIGNRFLQENPEVEVQEMNLDKRDYDLKYMSEDQICDYSREIDKDN